MKKKPTDGVTRLLNIGNGLVSLCAGLLAMVLILYSGYVLYDSMAIEANALSSNSDLLKYKPSVMAGAPDGPQLAAVNPDYRGWITVDGTPIDYPVVQGKDDLYYASHDAKGENSLTGAIYLAADNSPDFSDSYNLLYGHHMDSGAMFGSLDKYKEETYFKKHQKATLIAADGKTYDVTFFAVATTDAYEDEIYTVGNRAKQVISFLTGDRSHDEGVGTDVLIYDQAAAKGAEKVIALSTCASADTNGRLVVFGRVTMHETPTPTPTPTATSTPTPTATPETKKPHGVTTPTPTPETGKVKLTVKYFAGDEKVFPDEVYFYAAGEEYYVVAPQLQGYDVDVEILKGRIREDMIVIVHYTPKTYLVTVRYIMLDGTEISAAYSTEVRTGDSYGVDSPVIPGYRAVRVRIAGVNPGRNEEYTVIYVPEDQTEYANIDSYETPLNPGNNNLQTGVCAE